VIDLHIHTHASQDGQYPPRKIFDLAREHGLRVIAFADHDSVDSVPEGIELSREFGIAFVPAVEITTIRQGHELHLLAYYVDPAAEELTALLHEVGRARLAQSRKRCERLRECGYVVDYDRVLACSEGKPPTAYPIFRAVLENPLNRDLPSLARYTTGDRSNSPVYNFGQDYFNKDKPAYVPVTSIDTVDAVEEVRKWKAVPVLAHPGRTPIALVDDLIDAGLLGLEVYNPSHTPEQTAECLELARKRNLLVTAGSDFHGPAIKPDIRLAELPHAGYDLYEALKTRNAEIKGP